MSEKIMPAPETRRDETGRSRKRARLTPTGSETTSQSSLASSTMPLSEPVSIPPLSKKLVDLLDLRSVSSHHDLDFRFGEIARSLMHEHLLVLSRSASKRAKGMKGEAALEESYEFLEIEFYLRKEGHEDPFAHATPEQGVSGKWYFHRSPRKSSDPSRSATSLTGFRGGTRKGVDLTFGGPVLPSHPSMLPESFIRGGILLRSIRRISDGALISGPSLLVDELLRVSGAPSVGSLVADSFGNDLSAFEFGAAPAMKSSRRCSMALMPKGKILSRRPVVYTSPRIGLDLSHPGTTPQASDPRVTFIQKPYRFFVQPHLLTSNGRVQTFLGLYTMLTESEILSADSVLREVSRIVGLKHTSTVKYAAEFSHGVEKGRIEHYIGSTGKGVASSPSQYLRMMGTLLRVTRDAGSTYSNAL